MTKQKWIIALAVTFYGVATSAGATNLVNLNGNSAEGTPFGYVASGITIGGNAQISSESYGGSNGSLYFDGLSELTLSGTPLNLGTNNNFILSFDMKSSSAQNPW